MSGAFGGLLAGAITKHLDMKSGIRGWKWLFLIEGLATIVVSIIAWRVLPDFPATEKCKFSYTSCFFLFFVHDFLYKDKVSY